MQRREFVDKTLRLTLTGALAPRLGTRWPEPRPSPFLDAHVHSESTALPAYRRLAGGPGGESIGGEELVRRLDADGIGRAYVLSTAYQMASDVYHRAALSLPDETARVRLENDFTAEQCARFADRLVPFLSVNPKRAYAVDEIDRCVEQLHMRGLKLHLWNSLVDTRKASDLAAVKRVVAHAAQRGLPVVAHILVGAVPNYGPDDTERFIREVVEPVDSLKISIAHLAGAGGFGPVQQRCFERLTTLCGPGTALASRVWTDMAAILLPQTTPDERTRFAELVPRWGFERLFWGSDNITGALAEARSTWPLSDAAWSTIAANHGQSFFG
jgi:predicted TIM-barrel fold metal-dependent hydrolase